MISPERLHQIRRSLENDRRIAHGGRGPTLYTDDVSDLLAEVSRLSALLKEREWIPCSERLPSTDGVFIVHLADREIGHAYYVNAIWRFNGRRENRVTHWQPLPKPPTTEGEQNG